MYWIVCLLAIGAAEDSAQATQTTQERRMEAYEARRHARQAEVQRRRLQAPGKRAASLAVTLSHPAVKEELELVDEQEQAISAAMRLLASKAGACLTLMKERDKLREEDRRKEADELDQKIAELRREGEEESHQMILDALLPHQHKRIQQCYFWRAFSTSPIPVLEACVDVDPVTREELEKVYVEFQEKVVEQMKIYRQTMTRVFDKELGEHKKLLVEALRKPESRRTDQEKAFLRSWESHSRDLLNESDEVLAGREAINDLCKRYQLKLVTTLPEAERRKWYEMAGERPALRGRWDSQTVKLVGRFQYP